MADDRPIVSDPFADERRRLRVLIDEVSEPIIKHYRIEISGLRAGKTERMAELYRAMQRDLEAARAPFIKHLAGLPAEPKIYRTFVDDAGKRQIEPIALEDFHK